MHNAIPEIQNTQRLQVQKYQIPGDLDGIEFNQKPSRYEIPEYIGITAVRGRLINMLIIIYKDPGIDFD
jgi:hypothetical protein